MEKNNSIPPRLEMESISTSSPISIESINTSSLSTSLPTIQINNSTSRHNVNSKQSEKKTFVDRQKFQELQFQTLAAQQERKNQEISSNTTTSSVEINDISNDTTQDQIGEDLIEWLSNNDAETKKLTLQQYAPEVRGVHSAKILVPGERILVIPKKCLITVEMGKMTNIGKKLLAQNIDFVAPKHIYLMMFLLEDMENIETSFYKSYYSTLPSTLSNMPIFWSENELAWLQGSYIIQQIQERKAAIRKDYDAICRVDPSFHRFTLERFSWARMIVCSRNFGLTIDGIKTAALVPFADMLNHYRPRETSWTFDQSINAFTITSLGTLARGAQVYDSYGKKCNHRFLLNYGFAVEDNTEEDGSNPNEVMIDFDFEVAMNTSSDSEFSMESNATSNFINVSKSDEDIQLFYDKRAFLHESGVYTMDVRLSRSHSDANTREGFSFARLLVATKQEFQYMRRKIPHAAAHAWPPVSFANEIRALKYLRTLVTQQLDRYQTTIEEDEEVIAAQKYPLFSNRMQALFFIRGEKQVCIHFQTLADTLIPLFSLPINECKEELQANFDGDDDICRYAQDVIAYLVSQVYPES